jgi:hypothetical protein
MKDEEDLDMQEVEEVNVKTEKGVGSEEEEVEDVDTKKEVSLEGTVQCFMK